MSTFFKGLFPVQLLHLLTEFVREESASSLCAVFASDTDVVEQLLQEVICEQNTEAGRGANGGFGKLCHAVVACVAVQVVRGQHWKAAGKAGTSGTARIALACGLYSRANYSSATVR